VILRAFLFVHVVLLSMAPSVSGQERREVPAPETFGAAPGPDAAAIDSLIARYLDAWGRQDADALVALHAEDVEWINAYARLFRGDAALGAFLRDRLFPAFDSAVSRQEVRNMRMISRRYLGDDAAVIHMYTDGSRGESRSAGEELRRTHLHLVLEKRNGAWKVVHTAIMDAR
jgi:uncharacterized protein (TIGR02246 family)